MYQIIPMMVIMKNLLSLELDRNIYFIIFGLLQRHRLEDISDFEIDLIEELLDVNLSKQIEDIKYFVENTELEARNASKEANKARAVADEAIALAKKIKEGTNIDSIKQTITDNINGLKMAQDIVLDNVSDTYKNKLKIVDEIIKPLSEIIDYLDIKKTMNLRKPKEPPKKIILNLRNKIKEIIGEK